MKLKQPSPYTIICLLAIAPFLICQSSLMAGGMPDSVAITGINWAWQQTRNGPVNEGKPKDPSRYTINFKDNGEFNIQADCNWGGGTYTVNADSIVIKVTHTTKAMCPPGSLEQPFIGWLNASESFYIRGDDLIIEMKNGAGAMEFKE